VCASLTARQPAPGHLAGHLADAGESWPKELAARCPPYGAETADRRAYGMPAMPLDARKRYVCLARWRACPRIWDDCLASLGWHR